MKCLGRIFNIQHFSIHDGPGTRTVVFFKGCNLSCLWCHNPESLSMETSIMLYPEKCIGCQFCMQNCPNHCHYLDESGTHKIRFGQCKKCLLCTQNCYAEALVSAGEDVSIDFVMRSILSNKLYFQNSGGGVTFSGGESMLQIDFLQGLLTACKENGVHTAVDTAGNVPWDYFSRILPYTDLFLYDVKALDPVLHERLTGSANHRILQNLSALYDAGAHILVRVPYIKGFNDQEMGDIAVFLQKFTGIGVEVLPYHALGNSKYAALGMAQDQSWKSYIAEQDEIAQVKELFCNR